MRRLVDANYGGDEGVCLIEGQFPEGLFADDSKSASSSELPLRTNTLRNDQGGTVLRRYGDRGEMMGELLAINKKAFSS